MEIRLAVICDGANISKGEKLNILGAFSNILCPRFPIVRSIHFAIRFEFVYEDAGRHALTIEVQDMDGRVGLRATQDIELQRVEPGDHAYYDSIIVFQRTELRAAGDIFFVILWDGDERDRVPLRISRIEPRSS